MAFFLFHKSLTNPGHFLIVMPHTEVVSLQNFLPGLAGSTKVPLLQRGIEGDFYKV
jgi:hypothetical protein